MKFFLDENVHKGLFFFLIKLRYDVKLCPQGIIDDEVLNLSIKENRILITRDSDFLNKESKNKFHSGIILIRINPGNIKDQKTAVLNLIRLHPNFNNKIIKILSKDNFKQLQ